MWVLGGRDNGGLLNDVWSSSDGVAWAQATSAAPWNARASFGALVFNGQLWVMGGYYGGWFNDVWSTPNIATLGPYYLFQKQ
jgi:hypothetical protein